MAQHEMLLQFDAIVQVEASALKNMLWQRKQDERSQLLMSSLKEVAPENIAAHAHRRKHGEAEAEGGCEEGCRGAGRDAHSVLVTLAMFQLLMSWLKEVASANIPAHAHTRRKHGEAGAEGGCEEGSRGAVLTYMAWPASRMRAKAKARAKRRFRQKWPLHGRRFAGLCG